MSKINLIVVDSDTFFSQSFSRYILEHNATFEITTFTQIDYFISSLNELNVDILLIEKNMLSDDVKAKLGNYLVLLLDDVSKDGEVYSHINKYQKTENIIKDITFRFAESKGDKSLLSSRGEGAKIISVYSPVGGSGKTTISLAVAGSLAKNGLGVMYLSLEKFSSAVGYLNTNSVESISEIFLKLKNGFANISFEIIKRLATDNSGVKYLAPPESAMEFNEIAGEEFLELIKEISNTNGIDYVILDLPSEFNMDIINILKISSCIAFITNEDESSICKLTGFIKELNIFPELRITYDKMLPIVNKAASRNPAANIQQLFGEKPVVAAVPNMNLWGITSVSKLSDAIDNYIVELIRMAVTK